MLFKIIESLSFFSQNENMMNRQNKFQPIVKHNKNGDMNLFTFPLTRIKTFASSLKNPGTVVLLVLGVIASFSSCKTNEQKNKNAVKDIVVFPAPPEQARFQYLTKISTSADIAKPQSKFSKIIVGTEKPRVMVKPYGIAIHKGKIYVCDNYGGGMEIINLEKKRFDFFSPNGRGRLKIPINCFVDEKGYLYIADVGRYEIVIFDDKLNFVRSFGEAEKFKPSDVSVHDNKVFVSNISNNKINVYSNDSTNKLLYTIPGLEPGNPGFLCSPSNITIGNDRVYAADFGCSKIKIYSESTGAFLDTIGGLGDRPGQFSKLKGIAVDSEANVFAVDAAFEIVQVFNKEGKLLIVLGGHYQGPGGLVMPAKVIVDYDNLQYFQKYVDPAFDLKYLVFVTSQYGPDLINVYGRVEPKAKPKK